MPENMRYVSHFTPGYYDFALLHIDQQSIYEEDRENSLTKGRLFKELKDAIQEQEPTLPIVVINHMTPFHDYYETHETVEKIKKMTEGCTVICNSYTAAKQWGFDNVVTHGLDPEDWGFDTKIFKETGQKVEPVKEPRCIIVLSPAGMEKAYRREFARAVIRRLDERDVPVEWIGVNKSTFGNFDDYRDYLARSSVFFFPAWQSPRPRSRTEAMLSGCCIVTTPYQDADTFIDSGMLKQEMADGKITKQYLEYTDTTNGFLTSMKASDDPRTMDNPDYTADLIEHLVFNEPEVALEIGRRGKQYAIENFNKQTYEKQWEDFLKKHNLWRDL